jgi:hypothetical protein
MQVIEYLDNVHIKIEKVVRVYYDKTDDKGATGKACNIFDMKGVLIAHEEPTMWNHKYEGLEDNENQVFIDTDFPERLA